MYVLDTVNFLFSIKGLYRKTEFFSFFTNLLEVIAQQEKKSSQNAMHSVSVYVELCVIGDWLAGFQSDHF